MSKTEPVTFQAACVIEADYVYIAAKPDALHSEENFARLFFYDAQNKTTLWLHHDLPDWKVASMCVVSKQTTRPRMYAALSEHGDIEFTWPGGRSVESIAGAGLRLSEPPIFGYVKSIREIAGELYVCGSGGQVYRREEGTWNHIAVSLKAHASAPQSGSFTIDKDFGKHEFSDIDGYESSDLYVVGGDGDVFHFDGQTWSRCNTPTDEILLSVVCSPNKEVWIAGFNGTLLCGNVDNGFREYSNYDDNMIISSVALFDETPYLAANEGLFFFDKKTKRIVRVKSKLQPEIADANVVVVRDGVLWSFGYKDIAFFDGKSWTRVDHPDNPPIR